ncbi:MAG TPA: thioredoxin family protein [Dictyobacter sp.]|jgi:thiol-disulfide isomerase/thioredoxin|nr:thioredoxin family protein [Dictyobacter sp.]
MTPFVIRLCILLLVALFTWLIVWSGRRFVEQRRQRALNALPTPIPFVATDEQETLLPHVRILAFSSEDCTPCHRLQHPALLRVQNMRGESVSVTEIDAPASPELAQRYQVLTVPTTVVLDADGKAHAVNYGFANAHRLLEQVDAILSQSTQHA